MPKVNKANKVNNWSIQAVERFTKTWRNQIPSYIKYMLDFCLPSNHILDLACGFGRLFEYFLNNKQEPFTYTGYDTSSAMLDKFKKDFPDYKNSIHLHDITTPFKHKPSCVIASAIFMHLLFKDQVKVLSNISAICPHKLTFDIDSHNLDGKDLVEKINRGFRFTRQTPEMLYPILSEKFPNYKISKKSFKGDKHPYSRPDVYVFTLELDEAAHHDS